MEGIERPFWIANDHRLTLLMLVCLAGIAFVSSLRGFPQPIQIRQIFRLKGRESIFVHQSSKASLLEFIMEMIFFLVCGTYSLLCINAELGLRLEHSSTFFYKTILASVAIYISYFVWKHLVYFFGSLFLEKGKVKIWIGENNNLIRLIGMFLYPFLLLTIYIPTPNAALFYLFPVILLLWKLLAIYKGVIVFLNNIFSSFYLILYLCALEIAPILLLYRALLLIARG